MEKKKINKDKVLNSISNEEKFQKKNYKQLWFNSTLNADSETKILDLIKKSQEKVIKLKEKLK